MVLLLFLFYFPAAVVMVDLPVYHHPRISFTYHSLARFPAAHLSHDCPPLRHVGFHRHLGTCLRGSWAWLPGCVHTYVNNCQLTPRRRRAALSSFDRRHRNKGIWLNSPGALGCVACSLVSLSVVKHPMCAMSGCSLSLFGSGTGSIVTG